MRILYVYKCTWFKTVFRVYSHHFILTRDICIAPCNTGMGSGGKLNLIYVTNIERNVGAEKDIEIVFWDASGKVSSISSKLSLRVIAGVCCGGLYCRGFVVGRSILSLMLLFTQVSKAAWESMSEPASSQGLWIRLYSVNGVWVKSREVESHPQHSKEQSIRGEFLVTMYSVYSLRCFNDLYPTLSFCISLQFPVLKDAEINL